MEFRSQAPLPTSVAELEESEQLLVQTFRRWVRGLASRNERELSHGWCCLVRSVAPQDARVLLDALSTLIYRVAGNARRTILCHPPCCSLLGGDEWEIVALVACCQQGREASARRLAVRLAGVAETQADGIVTAAGLLQAGQTLPDRLGREVQAQDLVIWAAVHAQPVDSLH